MTNNMDDIMAELKEIKKDIKLIKDRMIDPDTILTSEEEECLKQSYIDEKNGDLISADDLKKELGIRD